MGKAGKRTKLVKILTRAPVIVLFFVVANAWATSPPQDDVSYRGDVNGDFVVTLTEVVAARDLTSLKSEDCTDVVPGTATTCDTTDLSGDGVVTLEDVVAIRDLTSLKPYSTPDLPWSLDTSSIPASITGSAPIGVAVTNLSGIGRPGIVVRFKVASGPATLSGREYNPTNDGIRDHASPPGATQVLTITITDFPGDQSGTTELDIPNIGTIVELVCTANGSVILNVDINEDTLKGIPALSDVIPINCSLSGGPMALISSGCFDMGDTFGEGDADELPVHNVCITSDFYMDMHEVTNAEYKACVDAGDCATPNDLGSITRSPYYGHPYYVNFPVIVDWYRATDYCAWLSKRLPTEAEWEYASRGGLEGMRYPWGNTISGTDANYYNSGDVWDNDTSPVENFPANNYGLYDMSGNLWEWVNDWYLESYYSVSPTNDPDGPASGIYRVIRGGSFSNIPGALRSSERNVAPPEAGFYDFGFRCARTF